MYFRTWFEKKSQWFEKDRLKRGGRQDGKGGETGAFQGVCKAGSSGLQAGHFGGEAGVPIGREGRRPLERRESRASWKGTGEEKVREFRSVGVSGFMVLPIGNI